MVCPKCLSTDTDVTNSRSQARRQQTWRRRKCLKCGFTFTTREAHDISFVMVAKKDGREEQFSRSKLLISIAKACNHMIDQQNIADALTDTVITKLMPFPDKKTTSQAITDKVTEILRNYDSAALVKYSSFNVDLSSSLKLKAQLKDQSK